MDTQALTKIPVQIDGGYACFFKPFLLSTLLFFIYGCCLFIFFFF